MAELQHFSIDEVNPDGVKFFATWKGLVVLEHLVHKSLLWGRATDEAQASCLMTMADLQLVMDQIRTAQTRYRLAGHTRFDWPPEVARNG